MRQKRLDLLAALQEAVAVAPDTVGCVGEGDALWVSEEVGGLAWVFRWLRGLGGRSEGGMEEEDGEVTRGEERWGKE